MKKLETLGLFFVCVFLVTTIVVAAVVEHRDTLGVYRIDGWNVRVTRSGHLEVGTIPYPIIVKTKDGKIVIITTMPMTRGWGILRTTTEATPEWQAI